MDFDLTEEQRLLKATVREYLEKEIAPQVGEYEAKGQLSREDAIGFIKQLFAHLVCRKSCYCFLESHVCTH